MINLKNVYNEINKCLDDLYDYEDYSGHINLVNKISEQIDLLGAYFGVRVFKKDVGPFKKDERIYVTRDEAGTWINSIDCHDNRVMDLFDYPESNIDDWFYPIPEPPVDVNQMLMGKKTMDETIEEIVNRLNYLVDKQINPLH